MLCRLLPLLLLPALLMAEDTAPALAELQAQVTALKALVQADHALLEPGGLRAGDNAWVLVSALLVLFMTIPGLSLFYGGLVRRHNVLGTMMQSLAITAVITGTRSVDISNRLRAIASLWPNAAG